MILLPLCMAIEMRLLAKGIFAGKFYFDKSKLDLPNCDSFFQYFLKIAYKISKQ